MSQAEFQVTNRCTHVTVIMIIIFRSFPEKLINDGNESYCPATFNEYIYNIDSGQSRVFRSNILAVVI